MHVLAEYNGEKKRVGRLGGLNSAEDDEIEEGGDIFFLLHLHMCMMMLDQQVDGW